MKQRTYLTMLFLGLFLQSLKGHAFSCSDGIKSNKQTFNAVTFLKSYEGQFRLGSCDVEIRLCDFSKESTGDVQSFAGDMLITTADGFQRYVPFFLSQEKNQWKKQVLYQGTRAFVYRFQDKNPDSETGKDESYDVEFVKKYNSSELDYIEIGFSSEVERRDEVNRKWIICGDEREKYIRENPKKHKIKSFWWRIINSKK